MRFSYEDREFCRLKDCVEVRLGGRSVIKARDTAKSILIFGIKI